MTVTDQETQVNNLLALDNDDFQTLVRNSLGKEAPELLWKLLASPILARRTYGALTAVYTDVCGQIGERAAEWDAYRIECRQRPDGKQAWFDGIAEYNSWRRRALGYRRLLSRRIGEIKQALPSAAPRAQKPQSSMSATKRVRLMETIFKLGWAIREHQQQCRAADIIPEKHDTDLWEALDNIEVQTNDGLVTVAEMLADIAAGPGFVPPSERDNEEVA